MSTSPISPAALRILDLSPEAFAVRLFAALYAENLSFTTYALLIVTARFDGPVSVAKLAIESGYSYHACRNQIRRSMWWESLRDGPLSSVILSEDAAVKLNRISVRLSRTVAP